MEILIFDELYNIYLYIFTAKIVILLHFAKYLVIFIAKKGENVKIYALLCGIMNKWYKIGVNM